ncbi:MAG: hypothetical protein N4A40_10700 [Tissierellales bacterium]|nr:hypothetical protein [Tissierellales bacterium]
MKEKGLSYIYKKIQQKNAVHERKLTKNKLKNLYIKEEKENWHQMLIEANREFLREMKNNLWPH